MEVVMRLAAISIALGVLISGAAIAAEHNIKVELNTMESASSQCR
jgi:hypothetical protein